MTKKLWEKDIFSIKKLFKEIKVTHGESRGNSQRKHTLNKNLYYMGGTSQEGKRPKNWEFYPLHIGFS